MHDTGDMKGMQQMHGDKPAAAPKSEAPAAFEALEANMSVKMTGDADVDFMNSPHHQGAIDMANVALKYGKDPVTRKLAQDIVKAQESESP